ncbi:hypothetical protein BH20ACT4_BH20ACT4_01560 [soil metagenome]
MSDDATSNSQHSTDPTGAGQRAVAVSSYVDGEATPDEVRMVESDAVLLADVRRIRALKDGVGAVPALSPAHRDGLLAGALSEFDVRHGAASHAAGERSAPSLAAPPPPSRSGGGRWLAVAAAVVAVVAAAGLVVALVTTSDSDDSVDVASDAPGGAEQNDLTSAADAAAGTAAATAGAADSDDEGNAAEAPTADTSIATSIATSITERESADPVGAESLQELSDDRAMLDWVLNVQDDDFSPESGGDVVCGRAVLGAATYRGNEVVVAIEDDRVVARDIDTCAEVLSTDAP